MPKKNKKLPVGKKPVLVLSRKAIGGWLVAIFFVCAWMFVVGVLVGRGTSPLKIDISELQKKLQIARDELLQQERQQALEKSAPAEDNPELDFYEALKKNGDEDQISALPPPPIIENQIEPAAPQTSDKPKKQSKKRLTKIEKKVLEPGIHPAKPPAEDPKPQPAASQSRAQPQNQTFTLQVAAFKNSADADKLVAELKQKGFSAYRAIGKVPGKGIWYRVRIGDYKNKTEAGPTIAKLKKAGKKPMLVEK